jgi:hypothetical protein
MRRPGGTAMPMRRLVETEHPIDHQVQSLAIVELFIGVVNV